MDAGSSKTLPILAALFAGFQAKARRLQGVLADSDSHFLRLLPIQAARNWTCEPTFFWLSLAWLVEKEEPF